MTICLPKSLVSFLGRLFNRLFRVLVEASTQPSENYGEEELNATRCKHWQAVPSCGKLWQAVASVVASVVANVAASCGSFGKKW
jgi:hypothetical protein